MARALTDIRSLARSHTKTCLNVLVSIARQKKAPESARVAASVAILDRGWGRPHQTVSGEDGKAIEITIRKMLNDDE